MNLFLYITTLYLLFLVIAFLFRNLTFDEFIPHRCGFIGPVFIAV